MKLNYIMITTRLENNNKGATNNVICVTRIISNSLSNAVKLQKL